MRNGLERLKNMFKFKIVALAVVAVYLMFGAPNGIRANTDEPVLLTVEIQAGDTAGPTVATFGYSDLTAFPAAVFTTTTNWTSGAQTFTGVPLLTLLDSLGVETGQLELIAINEYSIIMPVDDPSNDGAVIAYLMNGEPMTPRDKGPLWLVYNYDSDPDYRTETVYSRSIWQLDRMNISR